MTSDAKNTPAHQELAKSTPLASSTALKEVVVVECEEGDKSTTVSIEKANEGAEGETGEGVKPKGNDELKRMKRRANKQKRRERRKAEKMQEKLGVAMKPEGATKPRAPVDIERQCGVQLSNGALCARSLTCKSHSLGAKRALPGRSKPLDVLLADREHRKKNASKQALVTRQDGSQPQPGAQGVEGGPAAESRPEIS